MPMWMRLPFPRYSYAPSACELNCDSLDMATLIIIGHSSPLQSPVVTPICEHSFCRPCISAWLAQRGRDACPLCRSRITLQRMLPAGRIVTGLLNELPVKCAFHHPEGCSWTGKREEWARHATSCEKGQQVLQEIHTIRAPPPVTQLPHPLNAVLRYSPPPRAAQVPGPSGNALRDASSVPAISPLPLPATASPLPRSARPMHNQEPPSSLQVLRDWSINPSTAPVSSSALGHRSGTSNQVQRDYDPARYLPQDYDPVRHPPQAFTASNFEDSLARRTEAQHDGRTTASELNRALQPEDTSADWLRDASEALLNVHASRISWNTPTSAPPASVFNRSINSSASPGGDISSMISMLAERRSALQLQGRSSVSPFPRSQQNSPLAATIRPAPLNGSVAPPSTNHSSQATSSSLAGELVGSPRATTSAAGRRRRVDLIHLMRNAIDDTSSRGTSST